MKVYQEKIPFTLYPYLLIIFLGITFYFAYLFIQQSQLQQLSSNVPPSWFNLMMSVFFAFFSLIIFQFKQLETFISTDGILVQFGFFKRFIPASMIENIYLDTVNPFWSYGGWGIRLGKVNHKKRIVFNLPSKPCVVLSIKNTNKEFVFSTNYPDKTIDAIKSII